MKLQAVSTTQSHAKARSLESLGASISCVELLCECSRVNGQSSRITPSAMWGVMHPDAPTTLPAIPNRPAGVKNGSRRRHNSSALESPGVLHRTHREAPAEPSGYAYAKPSSVSTAGDPRDDAVQSAMRMADDAKKMCAAGVAEARERSDAVARRVESASAEIAALQRALVGATTRVDEEVGAAKRAVARCVARADAAASTIPNGLVDQFRGDLGALEQRLSSKLAMIGQEVAADEARAREHLAAALTDNTRRIVDDVEARIQRLESMQLQRKAQPPMPQEQQKPSSPIPRASKMDVAEAENRMEAVAKASTTKIFEEMARTTAAAAERDVELRQLLEDETSARVSLENTVSHAIEAAVRGVARATQKELVDVGERMDQIDEVHAAFEKSSRLESKSRFAAVEADLRDLRKSKFVALEQSIEDAKSTTRAFCEQVGMDRAEQVSTQLDDFRLGLEELKQDVARSHETVAAQATVARATDRSFAQEATKVAADEILRQTTSKIETARRECHRDAIAHARSERRGAEEYCDSRNSELFRRIELCEAATSKFDFEAAVKKVTSSAERKDDTRRQFEQRCIDEARAIGIVVAAQLAEDTRASIQTRLAPLEKAIRRLEAHADLQSKEILSLRRDLEDYDTDRKQQIAEEKDQVDALAAATRGQIVLSIKRVVDSTHVDAQRMIHELYDPLRKEFDHLANRHVVDLAQRLAAIEAAADPAAWHETMQAAAQVFAAEAHQRKDSPSVAETS